MELKFGTFMKITPPSLSLLYAFLRRPTGFTSCSRNDLKTKISTSKGERWFCSEKEAQAFGWRKTKK